MISSILLIKTQWFVKVRIAIIIFSGVICGIYSATLPTQAQEKVAFKSCSGVDYHAAVKLVETALMARVLVPVKGARMFTVRVKSSWWNGHGKRDRTGLVAAIACAVAGEGKRLLHLRLTSLEDGSVLFEY